MSVVIVVIFVIFGPAVIDVVVFSLCVGDVSVLDRVVSPALLPFHRAALTHSSSHAEKKTVDIFVS